MAFFFSCVVGVLGRLVLLVVHQLDADGSGLFDSGVTLSSHCSFHGRELRSHEADAVNWDLSAVLEDHDVADSDEVVVQLFNRAVPQNINLKFRLVNK